MSAPVEIAHLHVHSMRLASGKEALVARVLTKAGVAGFGFSFDLDAARARRMAAWDAAARERGVPLWRLLAGEGAVDALAPQADAQQDHPWEQAWSATLAAARANDAALAPSLSAGAGVDWSLEPSFAALRWLSD